jgi:hypothetical protein
LAGRAPVVKRVAIRSISDRVAARVLMEGRFDAVDESPKRFKGYIERSRGH